MDWQEQLRDIVANEQCVPSFEEWLATTGYQEISQTLTSPLQMRSIVQTLYVRYRNEYGKAA